MTYVNVTDIVERLGWHHEHPVTGALVLRNHDGPEAADTIATLRKQLENAREALDGYRAAVSFISADSWDGCSDCINILIAARCADMTDAMTINETAEHLKRIRLHYNPATLRALPTVSDGWEDIATAPKDGTEILLYTDTSKSDAETQSYVEAICEGEHVKRIQMGHWCVLQGKWEKPIIGDPIFWRPLPAPPSE